MQNLFLGLSLAALTAVASAPVLAKVQSDAPGDLAAAFCLAWDHHDASELNKLFLPDADFVNVGALWLHGTDIETFHSRLFEGRFRTSTLQLLNLKFHYLSAGVAVIRWSWRLDMTANGLPVPARFGLMTMIAEKRGRHWLISNAQNTNSGPATPEVKGLRLPIEVPRAP